MMMGVCRCCRPRRIPSTPGGVSSAMLAASPVGCSAALNSPQRSGGGRNNKHRAKSALLMYLCQCLLLPPCLQPPSWLLTNKSPNIWTRKTMSRSMDKQLLKFLYIMKFFPQMLESFNLPIYHPSWLTSLSSSLLLSSTFSWRAVLSLSCWTLSFSSCASWNACSMSCSCCSCLLRASCSFNWVSSIFTCGKDNSPAY